MTRIPLLMERDQMPPDAWEAHDAILASLGRMNTPLAVLMHAPEVAVRTVELGKYLTRDSIIPAAIRELAILTMAREFDCTYVWAAHAPTAVSAGIPARVVDAIARCADTHDLLPEHAAVIQFGRELVGKHRVSRATFDAVRALYGDRGLVELQALIGFYLLAACTLITAEVEAPPDRPVLPARPDA